MSLFYTINLQHDKCKLIDLQAINQGQVCLQAQVVSVAESNYKFSNLPWMGGVSITGYPPVFCHAAIPANFSQAQGVRYLC